MFELIHEHHPTFRAVLPGDRAPGLNFVLCDLDVTMFHGSMTIRALLGFRLHEMVYYFGV
jgi:hypothetical protein